MIDTLVVSASGNGNIGDQALLDATMRLLGERTIGVVVEEAGSVQVEQTDQLTHIELPGLLSSIGLKRFCAHREFASYVKSAREVVVVGADLMDGLYNPRKTVARFSLLHTTARLGRSATVTGFSWPGTPAPVAKHLARTANPSVTFCLRDPLSHQRFIGDGATGTQTADVVFSDPRREPLPNHIQTWLDAHSARGSKVAIVNASGLIERRFKQKSEYNVLLEELRSLGFRVAFLPHVVRMRDGDIEIVNRIFADSHRQDDLLISELLSPAQVRTLVSQAQISITGRMHLAVISLSQETPAITLATQGKVEGLYALFRLPFLAVEPTQGFGRRIADLLVHAGSETTRQAIQRHLPEVTRLARSNAPVRRPAPS